MNRRLHILITFVISCIMLIVLGTSVNATELENGLYKVKVTTNSKYCKILEEDNGTCNLLVKDGVMTAVFRLNSDGYDKIYVGKKEDAAKADPSEWIYRTEEKKTTVDDEIEITTTICSYEMPVSELDNTIYVATHSIAKGDQDGATFVKGWYDREFKFYFDSDEPTKFETGDIISLFEKTSKLSYDLTDAEYDKQELQTSIDALQQKYNETEAARAAAVTAKSNAESKVSNLNTTVNNLNAKIAVMGTKVGGVKAKAYRSSHKITVNWSKNSKVTGYKVYRATSLNGSYKAVKTTTSNTATIKNHKKGKTYYYKVIGYKNVAGSNVYTKDSAICVVKAK